MNKELEMLAKLANYAWIVVLALIAYPYTTLAKSSAPAAGRTWKEPVTWK